MAIDSFTGTHRFLSNFYQARVTWGGILFPCVENAYQAAKSDEREYHTALEHCSPAKAKQLGRLVELRDDWEDIKTSVMWILVRRKFATHDLLLAKLLATEGSELIEGNDWRDQYWGCVRRRGEWVGKNMLGKILMAVRKELGPGGC